jgi:hypothetical protein
MINRVHGIEQEKNALEVSENNKINDKWENKIKLIIAHHFQTQNSVLRRELERLTFLLQV